MSSVFRAISFIKNLLKGNKSDTGIGLYRLDDDEFVDYKFKVFHPNLNEPTLVEGLEQDSIALIIGRFAFEENKLNVREERLNYLPRN